MQKRKGKFVLALTGKRKKGVFLPKKTGARHHLSHSEEWRICLLAEWGFSYKAIAKRVFGNGNPKFQVSDADIRRVGAVLHANKLKVRDYRNMETEGSQSVAASLLRRPISSGLPKKAKIPA